MLTYRSLGPLILQRLVASWRLLAVLALGVLIAATLLAATPIYARVMNDLGLRTSLEKQVGSASRNGVFAFNLSLGTPEAAERSRSLADLLSRRLAWLSASEVSYAALPEMTLGHEGQPVPTGPFRPFVTIQTMSNIDD